MTEGASPCCPKCGEAAEPGFTVCWNCQTPLPAPALSKSEESAAGKKKAGSPSAARRSTAVGSIPVAPAPGSPRRKSARPTKRLQIVIGVILLVIGFLTFMAPAEERGRHPELPDFVDVLGPFMVFAGPGSLLIYFGLRSRFRRGKDLFAISHKVGGASGLWMLPGFVALVSGSFVGGGWKWGLSAVIAGLVLMFLVSTVEGSIAKRAWQNDPYVQKAIDFQMSKIGPDREWADLALMIRTRDISGLKRVFTQSDWQGREAVLSAFGVLCKEMRDGPIDRDGEMIQVLNDILTLCRADKTKGACRENCIEHIGMLLRSI